MEATSQSTSYHPLSLTAEPIVIRLCSTILTWVATLPKFPARRFLSLLQTHDQELHECTPCATNPKGEAELSREDVEMVMQKMGISTVSTGGGSDMAVGELSALFDEEEPTSEEAEAAFAVFDRNSDGFIDAEELQRLLSELEFREGVRLDECERMIAAHDENKDGRIDFHEFLKFMESSFC